MRRHLVDVALAAIGGVYLGSLGTLRVLDGLGLLPRWPGDPRPPLA